ncbi:protein REGULATOR OF FATTY ACID COMPOSITION 3, chloroplastic-like [Prosopis cineraria]|uniref:protein REGULATOR OF FATTY ACID COMPOSITION 3, chloroplastic-like n=1 Tax=Prosopis cineraria TaxID=364024 RepID=UPI002410458E|nr:protein REGULATOR OF FATTY ACID COMPOSITION 3, chloroplastic-like [Prosopis cineraria]
MEALLPTSSTAYLLLKTPKMMIGNGIGLNYNPCFDIRKWEPFIFFVVFPAFSGTNISVGRRKSVSVIVGASKRDKKEDSHSFIPKPDEATGFFPEAVLLKEKKVEEDGKVLPEFADAEERQLYESLMLELESDLDVDQMRHYEIVYLIHEKHEEEVAAVNEKIQDFLREKKGRVWRFSDWGMRQLAYKIKKADRAHYILMNFEVDAKYINEFKSLLDKDERVIRHLVVKRDEAITEDCPPPPEFHTLRANIDDEYDDEGEIDAEYDGDWDEEEEMDGNDGDNIIYIDGDGDGDRDGDVSGGSGESTDDALTYIRQPEIRRLRAEKARR